MKKFIFCEFLIYIINLSLSDNIYKPLEYKLPCWRLISTQLNTAKSRYLKALSFKFLISDDAFKIHAEYSVYEKA